MKGRLKEKIKKVFYSGLDLINLYKGVPREINGFIIRFPARWSKYYNNGYEKDTFDFFKKNIKQGDVILDVGAHIGLYAGPLAQLTGDKGKVYCFEPTPSTFIILKETIRVSKYKNIIALNAAVSDKSGTVDLHLTTEDGEGSNANTMVSLAPDMKKVTVKAYSIDDFRKENNLKIDVLKIDVEGAELYAIKGAQETFLLDKPIGILAIHPSSIIQFGNSLKEIWDCLMKFNLQIIYQEKEMDEQFFCSQKDFFDVSFSVKKQ